MFDYLIEKIEKAEFIDTPFPHLDIQDFLSEEHFNLILNQEQIHFDPVETDQQLHDKLLDTGWIIHHHAGCVGSWTEYLAYKNGLAQYTAPEPVQGAGITFRLKKYADPTIQALVEWMNGDEFHDALRKKFDFEEGQDTKILSAIQKNLSHYEISPHPDIRQKALTYLLNINRDETIDAADCHTHLLEFKPEYKYIQDIWTTRKDLNTCWVPWDWCNTVKRTNVNNSIVIFKPAVNPPTLHGIKLDFDHLQYQRTQIYGNLVYKNPSKPTYTVYTQYV